MEVPISHRLSQTLYIMADSHLTQNATSFYTRLYKKPSFIYSKLSIQSIETGVSVAHIVLKGLDYQLPLRKSQH
jgi:hypothetical protein